MPLFLSILLVVVPIVVLALGVADTRRAAVKGAAGPTVALTYHAYTV